MIESYKLLQPDPEDYSAAVLYALLASTGNSTALESVPAPPSTGTLDVSVSARWINGLWFGSLALSLVVALLSILVKQWLDEYSGRMASSSKNFQHWSRRRAFYFAGVQDWNLASIISILPVLLHLALFMFFGGLVVLLWSIDRAISFSVLSTLR